MDYDSIVVMGVSGSGKTTVGRALAARLDLPFFEGDDFHPPANIAKMQGGQPLTDADRAPWLAALNTLLRQQAESGQPLVLACSALRQAYREQLGAGSLDIVYVFLHGEYELIAERMRQRGQQGHFMPPSLLQSQFDAMEQPAQAILVSVALPVEEIVAQVLHSL